MAFLGREAYKHGVRVDATREKVAIWQERYKKPEVYLILFTSRLSPLMIPLYIESY